MDVGGGGSNIETLGIRTELVDNEVAAQQLKELGATGEATAQRIATAHKAAGSQIQQSYVESAARSRQVVELQLSALSQLSAGISGAGKQATDMAAGLARGLREQADAGRLSTAQIEQLTVAEAALAGQAKAATVAVEQQAIANTASERTVQLHGLQLGRLNQEIGTFIGRLTGANTAVTRLGAQIGGAVIGYGSMIAILAAAGLAIEGASKLYDHFTESARKAREENEKLQKSLEETSKRFRETATSDIESQVQAGRVTLRALEAQLAAKRAQLQAGETSLARNVAIGALTPEQATASRQALAESVAATQAQVDAQTRLIKDALGARARIVDEETAKQTQALAQNLASLIRSDRATAAEVAEATRQIAKARASLSEVQRTDPTNYAELARLTDIIKTLNDALNPKQRVGALGITGPSVERQAVLDALVKQGDELRRVTHEDNAQALAAKQAADAVGLQGEALAIFTAHAKAAQETLQAYATLAGPALTVRLEDIKANEQQAVSTAKQAQAVKDSTDQLKFNEQAQEQVAKIGQHNAEITRVETAEFERLASAVERDVLGALTKLANGGTLSFQTLVEAGDSLALRLVSQFDNGIAKLQHSLIEAIAAGDFEQAKADDRQIERWRALKKLAGEIGAAFAAAQIGFQFGQQAHNVTAGVVGGAVSGAAMGAQIAGPTGAVIGGLVGAASGLIGAAEAHKRAAEELRQAGKAIEQGLQAFAGGTSVEQALNANQAQYLALQTAIVNAMKAGIKESVQQGRNPGQAFQTAYEQLAQLEAERAANAQRIVDNFWADIQKQINAAEGPAGAFKNALIDTDLKFRDNILSARALGATEAQLAEIEALRNKVEEQLRAAEQERLAQTQFSLDAREAYAKGLTQEGKALERKAQEERELFEATRDGYTDAQIAQLKYIQGLEDEAAAKERATQEARTREDIQVRGLRAGGFNAEADAAAFRFQQQREMEDAIKAGMDPSTIVMLALVQALEADAFAAQQLQQAMQQARSDIARDVQLGFTTPDAAIAAEKQAFGFAGLSNDQIRALYTPFTGTALTPEQETRNQNIAQFFQDLSQFMGTGGVAQAATRTSAGSNQAIVNAAEALTEVTGNRMADYLDTIAVYVREIVGILRGGSRVASNAVANSVLSPAGSTTSVAASSLAPIAPLNLASSQSVTGAVPMFQPQPILPQATGGASGDALTQWFTGKPAPKTSAPAVAPIINVTLSNVTMNVTVTEAVPNVAELGKMLGDIGSRQLAKKLAPDLNLELARLTMGQRLRDGDPTKAG